jgi:hypothetical protein
MCYQVGFDEAISRFRMMEIARPLGDAPVNQPLPIQINLGTEVYT